MRNFISRILSVNYSLYSLGWNSHLHRPIPLVWHILLSVFYYYRRGYTEARQYAKGNLVSVKQ
jgi:hypothetical protein